jgi:hypothetical protein
MMRRQDGRTELEIMEHVSLGEAEDRERYRRMQQSVAQKVAREILGRCGNYSSVAAPLSKSAIIQPDAWQASGVAIPDASAIVPG